MMRSLASTITILIAFTLGCLQPAAQKVRLMPEGAIKTAAQQWLNAFVTTSAL